MSLETLLDQVRKIFARYEEEERKFGDKFNVFKVLGIKDLELFHSRFLYTLLDPKGDHGQDDLFLKLFFQSVLPSEIGITENIRLIDVRVYKEFDADNYGRFDIFIRHNIFNLIIENKIHAQDNPDQIQKYYCYLSIKFPESNNYILYLTLNGSSPVNSDISHIKNNLICKSYKIDIIDWLEKCNEKCCNLPLLHETITQYINIIKILTGQTRSKTMKQN